MMLLAEGGTKNLETALMRAHQVIEAFAAGLRILEMGRTIGTHCSYYTHFLYPLRSMSGSDGWTQG